MKDRIRSKRGFTLIEMMIVIAVMGILAAIAIPQFQKFKARQKAKTIEVIPQERIEPMKTIEKTEGMDKL